MDPPPRPYQRGDGWFVGPDGDLSPNALGPLVPPGNALGLQDSQALATADPMLFATAFPHLTIPPSSPRPVSTIPSVNGTPTPGPSGIQLAYPTAPQHATTQPIYYAASTIGSKYVNALWKDTAQASSKAPTPVPSTGVMAVIPIELPAEQAHGPSTSPMAVIFPPSQSAAPPGSSFAPQLPLLPAPPPRKAPKRRKRKRARNEPTPSTSDEEPVPEPTTYSRHRPEFFRSHSVPLASQQAPPSLAWATRRLAEPCPVLAQWAVANNCVASSGSVRVGTLRKLQADSDREMQSADEADRSDSDDQSEDPEDMAVRSLYEEVPDGPEADLLIERMLETQETLIRNVKLIDERTQGRKASSDNHPANPGSQDYASPPEPPTPINWDQTIACEDPAGRRRRAKRIVLLMGLVRETFFRLLSRRSVHDPLPPAPPPGQKVPTDHNFGIHWYESAKSQFNQIAAHIVARRIAYENPGMLTDQEVESLQELATRHIKYLCRCYKNQNREDAEEFNTHRLLRCSAGTRKCQLFQTRLQVIDRFPKHLGMHRRLIVHLGIDGTSSDEEDPKGSGIYTIKNKRELSSKVTQLK
ncbi:hypothetical protein FRC11_009328, partial [Ceratobasidium sp. 423]